MDELEDELEPLPSTMDYSCSMVIYCVDDSSILQKAAEELENFLTTERCRTVDRFCKCWTESSTESKSIVESISNAYDHNLTCKDTKSLTRLFPCPMKFCIRNFNELSKIMRVAKTRANSQTDKLCYDIVIILGHSSVPLAEDDNLIAAFATIRPTVIAFLGCCGGNSRYGPVAKMSYMLYRKSKAIIGFYQRRVYIDELRTTSLVVGLKYFICLLSFENFTLAKKIREIYGSETDQYTKKISNIYLWPRTGCKNFYGSNTLCK